MTSAYVPLSFLHRVAVEMPPPSRLDVLKYAPHYDEYLSTITDPDPNAKTRRDVAQCFIQTFGLNM